MRLLDVRISNPHRPESPRCHGWATYAVEGDGQPPAQLHLRGYADVAAWQRAAAGGGIPLAGLDLLVWRFPDDPVLGSLPALVDPTTLPDLLPQRVVAALGGRRVDARITVVRYQPGASATLRLQTADGGSSVYAKHLGEGPVANVAARHEALWALAGEDPALRVAEPLAADPDRRVLWTRGVPGRPLTAAVPATGLPAAVAPVGAVLAALHRSDVAPDGAVGAVELVHEAGKKAAKLAVAHPAVAPVVTALAERAAARATEVRSGPRVAAHGDFHLDQLVAAPEGPVLVDLDSMVRAAPELDLAEFLVDLALRRLPGPVAEAVAGELVAGYLAAGGGPLDPGSLALCADAEFVNRCYRHLRRRTPGWEAELEAELARDGAVQAVLEASVGARVTSRIGPRVRAR